MEQSKDDRIYFIYGVKERGEEVIKLLQKYDGVEFIEPVTGDDPCSIYVCYHGKIVEYPSDSFMGSIIIKHGVELHLKRTDEDDRIFCWDDIKVADGYLLGEHGNVGFVETALNGGCKMTTFAKLQQAESAQATAMISQIREQGKEVYGNINNECKFAILKNIYGKIDVVKLGILNVGGLLKFETQDQANMFLYRNRTLVENYLKTF